MDAYDKVGLTDGIKEGGLVVGVYDGIGVVIIGIVTVDPLANVITVPAYA
jgi:anaerobic C4-dicarboxylate transporter